MFRTIKEQDLRYVERMLTRIESSAARLFRVSYHSGSIEKAYIYEEEENHGVFIILKGNTYVSIQLSFERDLVKDNILRFLENEIKEQITSREENEVYLNINGYNTILIQYLTAIGFRNDSYGFEFMLDQDSEKVKSLEKNPLEKERFILTSYESEHGMEYLKLVDDAFRKQNEACNKPVDEWVRNEAYYRQKLKAAGERNDFYALWCGHVLAGLCLMNDDYLDILAVTPAEQKKGCGTAMLDYCIYNRFAVNHASRCALNTYYWNKNAQRFYLKNGFILSGFYSKKTYNER